MGALPHRFCYRRLFVASTECYQLPEADVSPAVLWHAVATAGFVAIVLLGYGLLFAVPRSLESLLRRGAAMVTFVSSGQEVVHFAGERPDRPALIDAGVGPCSAARVVAPTTAAMPGSGMGTFRKIITNHEPVRTGLEETPRSEVSASLRDLNNGSKGSRAPEQFSLAHRGTARGLSSSAPALSAQRL